ncbi:bifunctional cobalt-precorrin-7 (C(5))-methyltransferase/cobalt-precorrin-6B (C(15))-methyltransferase [Sphingomonas elodea]|uniref:bifunctional cobalt-precorrin-7 (C(5))-methyltransferase/cobalt-precorrin-6B (C(15))-methyltransferase n=1 Tax=Sphingomonas elodea TaxID=179878 RepID=UPI00026313C4|nr:bifunctional cobalt-precorrin-7 (C(5))-methyltransferase/cobalt-precorrin-6B (C(15))-methyltransferase [Sphingomonas elodea]
MADSPWLTILGLGEDGVDGLSVAACAALDAAELVMGAARHLALLPGLRCEVRQWPVPFAEGLPMLLAARGRRVVLLASGDPFWFGAGSSVTRDLAPAEWIAHPAPSSFALAASRLGWALQDTPCLGLHAAPFTRLRPHLAPRQRLLVLVRDGQAVATLAAWLDGLGFGPSVLHVLEALGGPRERVREVQAGSYALADVAHPVTIGIEVAGEGAVLPATSGRADTWFASDGQLTKRPVRALTLSALAPRPGELLWDLGAGSGSIGIEWLLAHPANRAIAVEADALRAERARGNAAALGVDRLTVLHGRAPDLLPEGEAPDAVFVGGGLSPVLLEALWARLPGGTRLVANAVTLESEALLARWHGKAGGDLMRIELADAVPLGGRHGWKARYPVVQWSVTR